jgi:hypothetical protein
MKVKAPSRDTQIKNPMEVKARRGVGALNPSLPRGIFTLALFPSGTPQTRKNPLKVKDGKICVFDPILHFREDFEDLAPS